MNLIFSWTDLRRMIRAKQRVILQTSLLCSVVTLAYFAVTPLRYEARATFKQATPRNDQGVDLKNLIRTFSSGRVEGTSTTIMLSDTVLEKAIEELGLQAKVHEGQSLFGTICKNIVAEFGYSVSDTRYARFAHVSFAGEKPLRLVMKKNTEEEWTLHDSKGEFLSSITLGEPATLPGFQLTLLSLPDRNEVHVTLHPIQSITRELRENLTIKPSREDKNLLLLKYVDQDRKRSAEVANTLMAMYEKYLVEENKIIIGAQLSYLNKRQDELGAKFDHDIEAHAAALQKNLQNEGLLGTKDEIDFVLEPLQAHKTRLNAVELELRHIDQRLANIDLEKKASTNEPQLIERYSKTLANQISSAKTLLEQLHTDEKISISIVEELKPAVDEFNHSIEAERKGKLEGIIREFMSHLALRQKSLKESSEWIETAQNDLSGINLETARKQCDHYSTQFDHLQDQLKQVMFMRDHLFDPNFKISTLSNILEDNITQQMIQKSSDLEAQLHDKLHRSTRDKERLKAVLTTHKRFLESHLNQTLQLGKVRIDLIKEKLASLYRVMKTMLIEEHKMVKEKINELTQSMQSLPLLWVDENRLKFKSELTKGMMEGLVTIAETKNLSHHLYQVESRPLDKAKPPLGYVKPLLAAKSILAFVLAAAALSFLILLQNFMKGFSLSLATLKELGAHTSGPLSRAPALYFKTAPDNDRETLRKLTTFVLTENKGVVAIIGEKQTSFFPALTELLKKHQCTSCVLDCSFGKISTANDQPGLYQILNGEALKEHLQSLPSYDFLSAGASSQDGVELLKSSAFNTLIQKLRETYDYIFLLSKAPLQSLESEAILAQSTHVILVADEPLDALESYLDPSRQKEKKHVTFIEYPT